MIVGNSQNPSAGQSAGIKINFTGVSQNTDTRLIGILEDKLTLILDRHHTSLVKSREVYVPFGIFVSVFTALVTGTSFSSELVKYVFIGAAFITGYLTFISIRHRIFERPMTVAELVDAIAGREVQSSQTTLAKAVTWIRSLGGS